ncbi:tumor necrosis factor ligand superfamily member 9 [Acomys russatus]|uniref:tumor necrosis factor ligand superfamily member 9 n=1 Tax=Acomys russatus TaxID=60746 RepID=UPI0021E29532|nr:tumor necrosis factor ligand superfamily member 9 [Acomys russatus]
MDQLRLDVEDTAGAGHPADTVLPSDAVLFADTVRLADAALPTDAVRPAVKVRDPEAPWPSARHSCFRRLLFWCLGALVLFGVVCGPIALLTQTQAAPAPTIPTLPGCANTKAQNSVSAKLLAKNEALLNENKTLKWHSEDGAGTSYLSPDLRYREDQNQVVVTKPGLYLVSLQLKLKKVSKNTDHTVQGWASLVLKTEPQAADLIKWAPRVDLSPDSKEAQGSWYHLMHLEAGHRLSVDLRVYLHGHQNAYKDWQLSYLNTTSFELFLVCNQTTHGKSSYPQGCY